MNSRKFTIFQHELLLAIALLTGLMLGGCRTFPTYDYPAEQNEVLDRLRVNVDEVDRVRWFHHNSLDPLFNEEMPLELYIGQSLDDPSRVWMRFHIYWSGNGWLFIHGLTLTADSQRIHINGLQAEGDVYYGGDVSESVDIAFTNQHRAFIERLIESDHAVLRLRGERGVKDYEVSGQYRIAFRDLLTAYDTLCLP